MEADYQNIIRHYERCLEKHGDSHRGNDWPNEADARTRYEVMAGVVRPGDGPVRLLDFGCGTGRFKDYLDETGRTEIQYTGADASEAFLAVARRKHPGFRFHRVDLLGQGDDPGSYDYVVMNGVFTEKISLSQQAMEAYFKQLLPKAFALARRGLAFNVMSKHVDWERDDLFHLSFDTLVAFLTRHLSRNFVLRNDYGLYEYTAYVYR